MNVRRETHQYDGFENYAVPVNFIDVNGLCTALPGTSACISTTVTSTPLGLPPAVGGSGSGRFGNAEIDGDSQYPGDAGPGLDTEGGESDPYRAECDRNIGKNKTYLDFIDAHRTDAATVANGLQTNTANILGLAALESTFGTSRFAVQGNNFFGLHSTTKNPLPGQTGLMIARGDPTVGMAMFGSFLGSAQAFALTKGQLIVGVKDSRQFASILQQKGKFGIGPKGPLPGYVGDLTSVIGDMAKRMDCDK